MDVEEVDRLAARASERQHFRRRREQRRRSAKCGLYGAHYALPVTTLGTLPPQMLAAAFAVLG